MPGSEWRGKLLGNTLMRLQPHPVGGYLVTMHHLGVGMARLPQDELSHPLGASVVAMRVSNKRSHTKRYPLVQRVRPAALAAYTSSSEGAAALYRTSSAKAGQLYETVSPTVQPYVDYAAVRLQCPAGAHCWCWSNIMCIHLERLMCMHG